MKVLFIQFIIIVFSSSSIGQQVWVTSSQITTRDQLVKLSEIRRPEFQDIDLVSFYDAQIAHPVNHTELQQLLNMEEKAHDLNLKAHFAESLELYLKLLEQLENVPNVSGIEKITMTTLIKIAETSSTLKKSDSQQWWKSVQSWASYMPLSYQQYSPAVIERINKMNQNKIIRTVAIKVSPDGAIYIDGHKISKSDPCCEVELQAGTHQVAVLAPGAIWSFQKINIPEEGKIPEISFLIEPAVTGDCDHPRFVGRPLSTGIKLLARFAGTECERVYDGQKWYSLQKKPLEMYLPMAGGSIENFERPLEHSWFHRMTHSPWFWIGAGVVTVGTVIAIKHNQESETVIVPTHANK